jgi:hypothetical protein
MIRVRASIMSLGEEVKERVSIRISRSLMASGSKNWASTLNRTLF